VLAHEISARDDGSIEHALSRYAHRRRPRADHVQQATAARNRIAARPLETRIQAIPHWEQISITSFAPLVGEP
jgi:2-polyprenyl-6-methoxyphenol hydroxylase-like FAD-dependent oxidoreductase